MNQSWKCSLHGGNSNTSSKCNFPDAEISPEFIQAIAELNVDNNESNADASARDMSSFWLTILKYDPLFETFVKEQDKSALKKQIASLPKFLKKRIRALELKTKNLEADFHRKVYELKCSFGEKHNVIFDKRSQIINGKYDPTEEECEIEDAEVSPEFIQAIAEPNVNENNANASVRGIPNF